VQETAALTNIHDLKQKYKTAKLAKNRVFCPVVIYWVYVCQRRSEISNLLYCELTNASVVFASPKKWC